MNYTLLTKEQLEELHQEFSKFLATQSIDKKAWDEMKVSDPDGVTKQLEIFSDLIWEGVLMHTKYLEHFSKNHIFLFACEEKIIHSIVIKSLDSTVDFLTKNGLQWLSEHMFSDDVELHIGTKSYEQERNQVLFDYIQQGAILSDGKLYHQIHEIITKK